VMITDLFARKDRFNVPGTAGGTNWSRRMGKSVEDWKTSRTVRKRMRLIRDLLAKTNRIS
jgi:4-alpha-glucanotransferase